MTTTKQNFLYPWLVWSLGASFFLLQYIIRISPSVMHPELAATFGINAYQFGLLAAFFYWPYILMQIPVGILLDKFGVRYLLTGAVLIAAGGGTIFASTSNIYLADFARFLLGFGSSFSFIGGIKLAADWFDAKYFGMLSGATQGLGMFGAAFGNTFVAITVIQLGWRHAIWLLVSMFFILALLIFIFVHDKHKTDAHPKNDTSLLEKLILICKSPQTWINAFYAGVMYAPSTAFAALWGVGFIERSYQIHRATAAAAVGAIYLGWAIGCPLLGFISDRLKQRKPILFSSALCCTIILTIIIFMPHLPISLLFALLFIYGIANSGATLSYAVASELHTKAVAGTSVSIANMMSILIGAICQPIVGLILDLFWDGQTAGGIKIYSINDYQTALATLIALLIIGIILSLLIKETFCQHAD
jgi:MFS family permease